MELSAIASYFTDSLIVTESSYEILVSSFLIDEFLLFHCYFANLVGFNLVILSKMELAEGWVLIFSLKF